MDLFTLFFIFLVALAYWSDARKEDAQRREFQQRGRK